MAFKSSLGSKLRWYGQVLDITAGMFSNVLKCLDNDTYKAKPNLSHKYYCNQTVMVTNVCAKLHQFDNNTIL